MFPTRLSTTRRSRRPIILVFAGALIPAAAVGTSGGLNRALRVGPGTVNHPVNVVPSSSIHVPSDWPLAPDGSITCTTCHQTLPALNGESDIRLRGSATGRPSSPAFCSNCHVDTGSRTGASLHWSAMGRAHVKADSPRSIGGGSMDRQSMECLSCHDGVSATETHGGVAWSGFGAGSMGDRQSSHSVGAAYGRKGQSRRGGALRPANTLPPEVRLPEGKVSCVSCHNLFERSKNHLSVPIEQSALCFTCHEMD